MNENIRSEQIKYLPELESALLDAFAYFNLTAVTVEQFVAYAEQLVAAGRISLPQDTDLRTVVEFHLEQMAANNRLAGCSYAEADAVNAVEDLVANLSLPVPSVVVRLALSAFSLEQSMLLDAQSVIAYLTSNGCPTVEMAEYTLRILAELRILKITSVGESMQIELSPQYKVALEMAPLEAVQ